MRMGEHYEPLIVVWMICKRRYIPEIFLEDMCPVVLSKTVWGMCCMKDAKYDM